MEILIIILDQGPKLHSITGSKMVKIGDPIIFQKKGVRGTIKFIGELKDNEKFVGIEFDKPIGKNNGCYNEKKYFECKDRHGVFMPLSKFEKIAEKEQTGDATNIMLNYKDMNIESANETTNTNNSLNQNKENAVNGLDSITTLFGEYDFSEQEKIPQNTKQEIHNESFPNIFHSKDKQKKTTDALCGRIDSKQTTTNKESSLRLNYEHLKLICKTQRHYLRFKIDNLKSQIKKLKTKYGRDEYAKLLHEVETLRNENLELKRTKPAKIYSKDQIDEFVLGVTKECLKVKQKIDEIFVILDNCEKNRTFLTAEHREAFCLMMDLLISILGDDENQVISNFEKFRAIMQKHNIDCNLD